MKSKTVLTILFTVITQSLFAYPITPRPLRKLVIESEYIVYADVIRTETIKTEDPWSNTKAILAIRNILQGKIKQDTIEVFYTPGMICPAPARYEVGTTVLAFLDPYKEGFSTHALSYGSKTIDNHCFDIYKTRIIEIQNILKIQNKKSQTEQTINWLVSCVVNSCTRWEGTYELSPHSDFMSNYDRDEETFKQKYKLNDQQISALRDAFFKIESLNFSDMGLIDLIATKKDPELLKFLILKLKTADIEKMWFLDILMTKIAQISERDDLLHIVEKINDLDYFDSQKDEKEKQLLREFINQL